MLNGQAAAVAVVGQTEAGVCELFNLATARELRGRASRVASCAICCATYQPRCKRMRVGTIDELMPFYERFGFRYSFTRKDFFLDEGYAGVRFDEGELRDMQVLELTL